MNKFGSILLTSLLSLSLLASCGGGGGDDPPPPPGEANLVVSTDPANGSVQAPALPPYNLKVTVSSVMPTDGVKIDITAKKDDGSGSPAFFTSSNNSSSSVNNYVITGTPANTQCLVEIKVTSRSKATNTWSGSYRYASK